MRILQMIFGNKIDKASSFNKELALFFNFSSVYKVYNL